MNTKYLREKSRVVSALAEFGFIPKDSMRKTVGCAHEPGGRDG